MCHRDSVLKTVTLATKHGGGVCHRDSVLKTVTLATKHGGGVCHRDSVLKTVTLATATSDDRVICYHHGLQERPYNNGNVCQNCCQMLASLQGKTLLAFCGEGSDSNFMQLVHQHSEDNKRIAALIN